MATNNPRILLVAANPTSVSSLAARFKRWTCEIEYASSSMEAMTLVRVQPFDLLLSEFKVRDESSSKLASSLLGSHATLAYSYPVETGCWWLLAVKNGISCWGSPAMRSSDFLRYLEDFLTVIRLRKALLSDESTKNLFALTPDDARDEAVQHRRGQAIRAERSADAA